MANLNTATLIKNNDTHPDREAAAVIGAEAEVEAASKSVRLATGGASQDEKWKSVVDGALLAVVVIKFWIPIAFEGIRRSNGQATGFVVDRERGLILTNRHVITAGPIVAEAVFNSGEVIPLIPWYRDPVHDFGFFKFEPSLIRFQTLYAITLDPHSAAVGMDICVLGNDSGEKQMALPGILTVLNRKPPHYDVNTFYYCASNNTSGGSSGSPVLTLQGSAIALNSGGSSKSATSLFIPLHGAKRALQVIQGINEGSRITVPRGDLFCAFNYVTFSEAERLSIDATILSEMRAHGSPHKGMLIVKKILQFVDKSRMSPFIVGDIIYQVNGRIVSDYYDLESTLNDTVNNTVLIKLQRGDCITDIYAAVKDLEEISPKQLYQYCGNTLHAIPYLKALDSGCPIDQGVYIAEEADRLSLHKDGIITAYNHKRILNLEDFVEAVNSISDGSKVLIHHTLLNSFLVVYPIEVTVEKQWFSSNRYYYRNDIIGIWDVTQGIAERRFLINPFLAHLNVSADAGQLVTTEPSNLYKQKKLSIIYPMNAELSDEGVNNDQVEDLPLMLPPKSKQTYWEAFRESKMGSFKLFSKFRLNLYQCFVRIEFRSQFLFHQKRIGYRYGAGLIVDVTRGLIVTSRYTVPHSLGSITCLIFDKAQKAIEIRIPAVLEFVHPTDFYCLVRYDINHPALREENPMIDGSSSGKQPTKPKLICAEIATSLPTSFGRSVITKYKTITHAGEEYNVRAGMFGGLLLCPLPALNLNSYAELLTDEDDCDIDVLNPVEPWYGPGIVCHQKKVVGIVTNINVSWKAISITSLPKVLSSTKLNDHMYILPCRYRLLSISEAKALGLPKPWIEDITKVFEKSSSAKKLRMKLQVPSLLQLTAVTPSSDAFNANILRRLDTILQINAKYMFTFTELYEATNSFAEGSTVDMVILRDGQVQNIAKVPLHRFSTKPDDTWVSWAGLVIQPVTDAYINYWHFKPKSTDTASITSHRDGNGLSHLDRQGNHHTKADTSTGGVWASQHWKGSPADYYGVSHNFIISKINNDRVNNVDDFLDAVKGLPDGSNVRLYTVSFNKEQRVRSLRTNTTYWPTQILRRMEDGTWVHEIKTY